MGSLDDALRLSLALLQQAGPNQIASEMVKEGIDIEHAVGDADYKICMSACLSATGKPVQRLF